MPVDLTVGPDGAPLPQPRGRSLDGRFHGAVRAWRGRVPALQVRATNSGAAAVQVTSVTLSASGTGADATGIAGVGPVLDVVVSGLPIHGATSTAQD